MKIREFQELIRRTYYERDFARGMEKNYLWLTEEIGELAEAIRKRDRAGMSEEFADVLAWLSTLATILGIDLEEAALAKYGKGCPRCAAIPCGCAAH